MDVSDIRLVCLQLEKALFWAGKFARIRVLDSPDVLAGDPSSQRSSVPLSVKTQIHIVWYININDYKADILCVYIW